MAASRICSFFIVDTSHQYRLSCSAFHKPWSGRLAVSTSLSLEHCLPLSGSLSNVASLCSCNGRRLPGVAALAADPFELDQGERTSVDFPLDSYQEASPPLEPQPLYLPERNKLFIGNLPWSMDSLQLSKLFEDIGSVEMVEVIYDRETGRSRGFAFVTMSAEQEATTAVERLDGVDIGGRKLRVNLADESRSSASPGARYDSPLKIFVGNLPWSVDDVYLEQIFSEHGKVLESRVVYDRETGRSRGFGFVTLSTEAEVNKAITSLDGSNIDGRPIRVNLASDKPASRF